MTIPDNFFAQRVLAVSESPTLKLNSLVKKLVSEGQDVISLAVGEPDFDTPDQIKMAAVNAMMQGETKYTPVDGTPELKKAIVEKFRRENELTFTPDQVIVTSGGKQALSSAIMTTVGPGDEVIIPAPYWVSYPDMVKLAQGTPVIAQTTADNDFKLTPEALEAAITPKTKWIILNSPSNPTGATYSESELSALSKVLLRHENVWVLSDDIYEHIRYSDTPFKTISQVEPKLLDRTLIVNGVSKAYSMTGWRIGYAAGPKELVKEMGKLQGHTTSNPCSISQAAAVDALNGPQEFLKNWVGSFKERRDFVVNALNEIPGISCIRPEGAFYVYPCCEGVIGSQTKNGKTIATDEDFVMHLISHGIAPVHGGAFGLSPYLRISYATSMKNMEKACARFRHAVDELVGVRDIPKGNSGNKIARIAAPDHTP